MSRLDESTWIDRDGNRRMTTKKPGVLEHVQLCNRYVAFSGKLGAIDSNSNDAAIRAWRWAFEHDREELEQMVAGLEQELLKAGESEFVAVFARVVDIATRETKRQMNLTLRTGSGRR